MAEEKGFSSKTIMYLSILIAVVLVVALVPFAYKGKGTAGSTSADDADSRIAPVARVEMAAAAPAAGGAPKDGPTVYNTVCTACHSSGAAGSPKTGDKAAWGPRIAQGKEVLYKSALNGKNAMPARGGAATLSDDEVKAAVDYLVGQAK